MKTTAAINFYCRESRKDRKGEAFIEASVIIKGQRELFSCGVKCRPKDFNKKNCPQEVSQLIESLRVRFNDIMATLIEEGIPVTPSNIKSYFLNPPKRKETYTVGNLFDEYFHLLQMRIGKSLTKETYNKYRTVRREFETILPPESPVSAINPSIIKRYQTIINSTRDLSTTRGMLTKLKAIMRYAQDNDYITKNPFMGIKIQNSKKPIQYLTDEDINKLLDFTTDNKSLMRVKDLAIFQLSTGLSYIDLAHITKDDMQVKNNIYYIAKKRYKTDIPYLAIVLKEGIEIWHKYNGNIPILCNQKYNEYLKVIGNIAGISLPLHSHLFRHTYCTRLINSGVRMDIVSKCVGHTSIRTTQTFYAHINDTTIMDEVAKAFR